MQYPIIDNLIYAYLKNGWTGLNLTYGKNLFDSSWLTLNGYIDSSGEFISNNAWRTTDFIDILPNTTYTFNPNQTAGDAPKFVIYNENLEPIQVLSSGLITFTTVSNAKYYRPSIRYNSINIQLEIGSSATPYEPYALPTTDIDKRLKLPMIHYFPHPVIDALISASDGQQTEEENKILRHYLTPLGIGGI